MLWNIIKSQKKREGRKKKRGIKEQRNYKIVIKQQDNNSYVLLISNYFKCK